MLPIVVVPVLNEEKHLEATCRSLGFGSRTHDPESILVLVDNGSTDGTPVIAERIRASSRPGRVLLVREADRGYVPARVRGVRAAAEHSTRVGQESERTLVLQADADTIYEAGYVGAMVVAASKGGRGQLYEGVSIPPQVNEDPCRSFRELEASIDVEFPMVPDELDAVVDDKVAAYILADYEMWGGHRRERSSDAPHDEWLAETLRLFVRARLSFAVRRLRVEEAMATTSSRRILENPALAFATAGFPHGVSWRRRWAETYGGPRSLAAFSLERSDELDEVIEMRRRHLAALFRFLPDIVAREADARVRGPVRGGDVGSSRNVATNDQSGAITPGEILRMAFEMAGIGR